MIAKRIKLLVSVRSVGEAWIALEAGVDCIDIKEPANGPMGRASYETIAGIVEMVAGRTLVGAALGEFDSDRSGMDERIFDLPIDFLKWGTSGMKDPRTMLTDTRIATVFYADREVCDGPSIGRIDEFFPNLKPIVCMVDTYRKDGKSVFDHLSFEALWRSFQSQRRGSMQYAIAGSIRWEEIEAVKKLKPDWLGVRGLVCEGGDRKNPIEGARIRRLKRELDLQFD